MSKIRVCVSISSEVFKLLKEKYYYIKEINKPPIQFNTTYFEVTNMSQFIERALINELGRIK